MFPSNPGTARTADGREAEAASRLDRLIGACGFREADAAELEAGLGGGIEATGAGEEIGASSSGA